MFKKRIKLYIHIGQPKTGSSAIQSFLNTNRKLLADKYSVLYPNFDSEDFSEGRLHNHAPFFMNTIVNHKEEDCYQIFKNIKKYCHRNNINKIVLSNEGFFWHWWPALLKVIIDKFDFDFSVILYLRRQDKYLESAWKQWGHKLEECENIQEYYNTLNLDWLSNFHPWLTQFDKSSFQVFPYEKAIIGDDITHHFLNILGLEKDSDFVAPPPSNENYNTGFNRDVIEVLRLSKSLVKDQHDHSLLDLMQESLGDDFKRDSTSVTGFLSPKERLSIIEQFEDSNHRIAEIFLDKNTKLFNNPLPTEHDSWEPYNGLDVEKIIPVLMDLIKKKSDELKVIKQELRIVKNNLNSNKSL